MPMLSLGDGAVTDLGALPSSVPGDPLLLGVGVGVEIRHFGEDADNLSVRVVSLITVASTMLYC